MAVKNNLTEQRKAPQFQSFIKAPAVLQNISSTLGDESKQKKFVASIISAVSTNPALQECESATIISSALLGESLNLSPSPQLGHYYMVPYKKKDKSGNVESVKATFQLGYKGYLQLAIRSGQYKKINVLAIKEGELINYNPLEESLEVNLIEDELVREDAKTIGFYAMFELVNGFRKTMYWSSKKMQSHADKYSMAFNMESYRKILDGKILQKDLWKYSSFWYKDFDGMAFKTMLRQLISKWGIMSIELQSAFENDMTFKDDLDSEPKYFDNDNNHEQIEIIENASIEEKVVLSKEEEGFSVDGTL